MFGGGVRAGSATTQLQFFLCIAVLFALQFFLRGTGGRQACDAIYVCFALYFANCAIPLTSQHGWSFLVIMAQLLLHCSFQERRVPHGTRQCSCHSMPDAVANQGESLERYMAMQLWLHVGSHGQKRRDTRDMAKQLLLHVRGRRK